MFFRGPGSTSSLVSLFAVSTDVFVKRRRFFKGLADGRLLFLLKEDGLPQVMGVAQSMPARILQV